MDLRAFAVSRSLFPPTTLGRAIERLGFVQADPIRSPARAQDLILRHRVLDYRAGDLERRYPSLPVEEEFLYAYGFVSRRVWRLVTRPPVRLTSLERAVLERAREGPVHPADLEARQVRNAWGGRSKATTRALDHLHYRGLLRVVRRENGIRVYEAVPPREPHPDGLRELTRTVAGLLAPVRASTLRRLVKSPVLDDLESATVDGVRYVWPPGRADEGPRRVRFLAPFDPIVWDRLRFEHLWGWPYRFEAYTPAPKRVRGYYAMPLLWGTDVVGWANAKVREGRLDVECGYVRKPRERGFRAELDAEIARLESFISPR